jgi:hypothetical protein
MENVAWCQDDDDVIQAAFHALKIAHNGVPRHLCRKTNPQTNPTGAKMKTCSKESTCRSFGSWCMVYIRSSNGGEQETNHEASNKTVVWNLYFISKISACRFCFEEPETPRQTISKNLQAAQRYIPWGEK